MDAHGQNHIHALTSLRFFAAFYVLVFHAGAPFLIETGKIPWFLENLLQNGFLGVTFFFILSGYILTYVYYSKLSDKMEVTRYVWARLARVYPVYLLALVIMVPFVSSASLFHTLPQFFLLQSWIPFSISDGSWVANWNGPAWTLSVELFFYLIFPWVLLFFKRFANWGVTAAVIFICLCIIAFRLPSAFHEPALLFTQMRNIPVPLLRAPEFIFGVLLGILYLRDMIPAKPWLLNMLIGMTFLTLSLSSSLWVTPIAALLFGGIIVLISTSLKKNLLGRILNNRVLVLLGRASFTLYILQTPVLTIREWMFSDSDYELLGRVLYIPSMLSISVLVFLFYEEKVRALLRNRFMIAIKTV